jgi:uncharacterized protein YdaL
VVVIFADSSKNYLSKVFMNEISGVKKPEVAFGYNPAHQAE